jgi:uncharacterized protein YqjF (DUF2071 family)
MHWETPVELLRALVPEPLQIDTFEGKAYVGVVPFTMEGIRPTRHLPPIPGVSAFHEANVRTYVHLAGKDPGVYFFSLDAANSLAVRVARRFWNLPYFRADMTLEGDRQRVKYKSERLWPDPVPAKIDLEYTIGEPVGASVPGSLQFFFAERYWLYSNRPDGSLRKGQVHHQPYWLREANVVKLDQSLTRAAKIEHAAERAVPDLYCAGVDVEVFALEDV